jgi:hypothetical protein
MKETRVVASPSISVLFIISVWTSHDGSQEVDTRLLVSTTETTDSKYTVCKENELRANISCILDLVDWLKETWFFVIVSCIAKPETLSLFMVFLLLYGTG